MAINSTTRQTTAYTTGNNFAFAFKVFTTADVKVIKIQTSNGAETVLNLNSDYTVTLNGDQDNNPGGSVTLSSGSLGSGSLVGFNIVITSKVEAKQLTELTNQGGFFPSVINNALDKSVILHQQQQNVIDKTIRFRQTDGITGLEITDGASTRATKTISFDSNGNVTLIGPVVTTGDTGTITTNMIGDDQVTPAKIGNADLKNLSSCQTGGSAALSDLTQAEVQILDGATVSTTELNKIDGLTAAASDLNKLDGMTATKENLSALTGITAVETSVTTNSNTKIPTSKAVNDLVLTVTNALGGFVAIANATSFPTSHPDPSENAGTVVSITDANGIVVNSSGVATISNGAGSSTVTINGFPTDLRSKTLGSGIGLQVQTTTTLHTYDYHKALVKESDLINLSNDIDDFNNRYRVVETTPTSNNDEGDLIFRKSDNKLLVFNGSTYQEASSIGNFHTNTLSSFNGTGGGSATFNGSAYKFNIDHPPELAEQLLVSINGVIQKPNSGTSQPSEGFALDGSTIIFGAAPASGSDFFIITIGKSVNIGVVSDGSIDNAKVASNASIEGTKINPNFGSQNISTTGSASASDLTLSKNNPTITLTDDNNNPDYQIGNINGVLRFQDTTNNATRFQVNTDGHIDLNSNVDITGNLVATGNEHKFTAGTSGDLTLVLQADSDNNNEGDNPKLLFRQDGELDEGAIFMLSNTLNIASSVSAGGGINLRTSNTDSGYATASTRMNITPAGQITMYGNVDCNSGLDVSGILTVEDASGSDPTMQINHSDADVTGEFLRVGRTDLSTIRYHSIKAKHGGAATANLISFNLHNASTTTSQTEVLKLNGDGSADFAGNLTLPDNGQLQLGDATGGDLKIYHSGSNAFIDNTTGHTYIRDNGFGAIELQPTSGEKAVVANANTSVDLYYDGGTYSTPKLSTTSTGIDVDGRINVSSSVNTLLTLTSTTRHCGFSMIDSNGSSALQNRDGNIRFLAGGDASGSGASDVLFINGSLGRVGIGTTSVGATLHLSSTLPELRFTDTDNNNIDHFISCSGSAMTLKADESQEDNAGDTTIRFHIDTVEKGRFDDAGLDVTGAITSTVSAANTDILALKANMGTNNNRTLTFKAPENDSGVAPFTIVTGNSLEFEVDNARTLFIDDSGQVNLHHDGSTTAKLATTATGVDVNGTINVSQSGNGVAGLKISDGSATSSAPYIEVIGRRDGANFSPTFSGKIHLARYKADNKITNGNVLGAVAFGGNHTAGGTSNILYTASISGVASDSFDSATDMPTDLVFYTGSTGRTTAAANVTTGDERMRITATGNLAVDTDTLFVDSTNDRIGINNASPAFDLDVTGMIRSFATGGGQGTSGLRIGTATENFDMFFGTGTANSQFSFTYGGSGGADIVITHDGIVKLFNGGGTTPKLATTATGVQVNGNIEIETGTLIIDTNADSPNTSYGLQEAIRIDDAGGNLDRGLHIYEYRQGGMRYHSLNYNLASSSTGSAYQYTQGNYASSTMLLLNGKFQFYVDSQVTGGSTDVITPTERFRVDTNGADVFGNLYITSAIPQIFLTDTGDNPDYVIQNNNGQFRIYDSTNNAPRLTLDATDLVTTGDGTFDDIRIGEHTNADFGGIFHKNQSGSEYMMISKDEHTFISASSGHAVSIVGGDNSFANNIQVHPANGVNITAANNVNILNGNIDFSSNSSAAPQLKMKANSDRGKLQVWNSSAYAIGMGSGYSYGSLNSFAMTFQMYEGSETNERGWVFIRHGKTNAQGAMSLTVDGRMTVAHSMRLGYGENDTTASGVNHALDVSGNANITGTLETKALRFGDSHVKRISVDYVGTSYLVDNEFQEILTITPAGNSQNYSVIGRIIAASGANVHTIDINVALRSNTLPDLTVSGSYISTITGTTEYLTPRFWLKETTTAAFKLVVEINQQIFGRVTADLEIITRGEANLNDIVVNEDETSEVTSLPTGYAQTTPTKIYESDDGVISFDGALTAGGLTFPTSNGNDGQVLTSDGAGNVQWEDATGGGGSSFNGGTIQNELILDPTGNTHPKLRFVPSSGRHFYLENNSNGLDIKNQTADGSTHTINMTFEASNIEIKSQAQFTKTADFSVSNVYPHINAKAAHSRNKINLYSGFNYQIGTENVTYGGLNSSAITFSCTNNDSAGFIFTSPGHGSNDGAMAITANGKVTIAHSLRLGYGTDDDTTTPGATHALDVSGSIASTSTITCTSLTETSDIALKQNIQPLSNVLDKVKQLTGYKYNFKNKDKASMGVIAQDVEKVFPELVHGEEGKKSLQYSGLVGALIEAVKELSAKVAALESS